MQETTQPSSIMLSKGAVKIVSPPVLDTMTELEICSSPSSTSSSVQANVYLSQNSQNLNIQDPILVIPLLPPQLSSKTLATVEQPGFIRLRLQHGMVVDISNDLTIRLFNPQYHTTVSLSESGRRAAVIHPSGRALFKLFSLEVQCDSQVCTKKARIDARGVSFTGSHPSKASYVLTVGGVRPIQEEFSQNLQLTDYVETQFSAATFSSSLYPAAASASISRSTLAKFRFETTGSEEVRLVSSYSVCSLYRDEISSKLLVEGGKCGN